MTRKTDYQLLSRELRGLIEGVNHVVANLANASALINEYLSDINWVGFYLLEDNKLVLGPFQGKVACIEIAIGKGVCGTAASEDRTLLVANVHEFKGHIACDSASNSEIVIPLHKDNKVYGVLDIDSPMLNRFTAEDKEGLELLARVIEEYGI
ncbi:MAG: GAF domain-containing protein [Erysipelotrichaceae bacterium]|nr:GAF domain-containing protein [Erysipelotrichaceae bacterium]